MHLLLHTFCIASALLLSSCVMRSNIGANIREPGTVYTGVSLCPVDGMVYKTPQQAVEKPTFNKNPGYALLPEVSFRKASPPVFEAHSILLDKVSTPIDIHPTGRIRPARICVRYDGTPESVLAFAEGIPIDAQAQKPAHLPESGHIALDRAAVSSRTGWARRLAAAPFDYLIDPALTIAMYAGGGAGAILLAPFAGIYSVAESACSRQ